MLENFKFIATSLFIIILLGLSGYWAFSTIESGSSHVDIEKQKELIEKNKDLEKEILDLKRQISLLESDKEQILSETKSNQEEIKVESNDSNNNNVPSPISKNQALINDLQKLVDGKIFLKVGSKGTAVGTVQKFLNIYNNTSSKIDNDYGSGTANIIKTFQKSQGLTADGETGPNTYLKMINWLKSH